MQPHAIETACQPVMSRGGDAGATLPPMFPADEQPTVCSRAASWHILLRDAFRTRRARPARYSWWQAMQAKGERTMRAGAPGGESARRKASTLAAAPAIRSSSTAR
jgi:hypothetical protein